MEIELLLARVIVIGAVTGIIFWLGYGKGRDDERYKDAPKSLHSVQWPVPKKPEGKTDDTG